MANPAHLESPRARRLSWRRAGVGTIVILVLAGALLTVSVLADSDFLDPIFAGSGWLRVALREHGYLGAIGLLYAEESGVPMPAPGDVFVMYVGAHIPRVPLSWLAGWVALMAVVLLGSSNLFMVSRHFGRRLVDGRPGRLIHITPARMARAEGWFARWGVWAIIFGRHIPGFRVPITVGAGLFGVPYARFAVGVVISTAAWTGIFMFLGITYGARIEAFMRLHRESYLLIPLVVIALILVRVVGRHRQQTPG